MEAKDINGKQTELRKLRSEYQDKIYAIQKEIDDLEIKKYNIEQYLHKFIKYNDLDNPDDIRYMYVQSIERLFAGPKFVGITFTKRPTDENNNFIFDVYTNSTFILKRWDAADTKIEIVDKTEIQLFLDNNYIVINNILNSL